MTSNGNTLSERETEPQRDSNEKTIEEQRIAIVDEIEGLLEDFEAKIGYQPGRVLQNINLARADLLDDGEFNYCVRLALLQLQQDAEKTEDDMIELREEITALREQLSDKAVLPPQDQISR